MLETWYNTSLFLFLRDPIFGLLWGQVQAWLWLRSRTAKRQRARQVWQTSSGAALADKNSCICIILTINASQVEIDVNLCFCSQHLCNHPKGELMSSAARATAKTNNSVIQLIYLVNTLLFATIKLFWRALGETLLYYCTAYYKSHNKCRIMSNEESLAFLLVVFAFFQNRRRPLKPTRGVLWSLKILHMRVAIANFLKWYWSTKFEARFDLDIEGRQSSFGIVEVKIGFKSNATVHNVVHLWEQILHVHILVQCGIS